MYIQRHDSTAVPGEYQESSVHPTLVLSNKTWRARSFPILTTLRQTRQQRYPRARQASRVLHGAQTRAPPAYSSASHSTPRLLASAAHPGEKTRRVGGRWRGGRGGGPEARLRVKRLQKRDRHARLLAAYRHHAILASVAVAVAERIKIVSRRRRVGGRSRASRRRRTRPRTFPTYPSTPRPGMMRDAVRICVEVEYTVLDTVELGLLPGVQERTTLGAGGYSTYPFYVTPGEAPGGEVVFDAISLRQRNRYGDRARGLCVRGRGAEGEGAGNARGGHRGRREEIALAFLGCLAPYKDAHAAQVILHEVPILKRWGKGRGNGGEQPSTPFVEIRLIVFVFSLVDYCNWM
ncbi:hypothetical protein EDB83DRAFT_2611025 [Lactarius deliciosus]|nr:hypothetical protein EDB83DRAFT_2611025 [Lactarius deliciosus]